MAGAAASWKASHRKPSARCEAAVVSGFQLLAAAWEGASRIGPLPLEGAGEIGSGDSSISAGAEVGMQTAPAPQATFSTSPAQRSPSAGQSVTQPEPSQRSAQGHSPEGEGAAMSDL